MRTECLRPFRANFIHKYRPQGVALCYCYNPFRLNKQDFSSSKLSPSPTPPQKNNIKYRRLPLFFVCLCKQSQSSHARMKRENTSDIIGNNNIVIQEVTDSTITFNINGESTAIRNDIAELKAEMQKRNADTVQVQGENFHINEIETTRFHTSLQNCKNSISNSTVHAGRDLHLGDNIYHQYGNKQIA